MFDLAAPWWTILVRSLIVYLGLLTGLRLFGRRELGQMTPFDLAVILLIANALQNAMVGTDTSVTGGLLAAAALLTANWVLGVAQSRIPWLRRAAEGEPILLISSGKVLTERLRKQHIGIDELAQSAREHGLPDLSAVDTAILEVDGTISIIPLAGNKIHTQRRVRQIKHQG